MKDSCCQSTVFMHTIGWNIDDVIFKESFASDLDHMVTNFPL